MGYQETNNRYKFVKSFGKNLKKNTNIDFTEDNAAYIKSICENTEPYTKIDNKGRHSSYFTFRLEDILITVVCDADSKVIITAIIETHNRPQYKGK